MTLVLQFFILRLWLRPKAEGQSLSGPNIRLRLKLKIAPTVQHCITNTLYVYFETIILAKLIRNFFVIAKMFNNTSNYLLSVSYYWKVPIFAFMILPSVTPSFFVKISWILGLVELTDAKGIDVAQPIWP